MLDDELQLLEPTVRLLRPLVWLAVLGVARLRLGGPLVRARVLVDLLPRAAHVPTKRVDDRLELCLEIVAVLDETRRLRVRARSIWTHLHGAAMRTNVSDEAMTRHPSSRARRATGSLGTTRSARTPRRVTASRQPCFAVTMR